MLFCRVYGGFLRKAVYRGISLVTGSLDQKYLQRDKVNNFQRMPYSKKSDSFSEPSSKEAKNNQIESTGADKGGKSRVDSGAEALEKQKDKEKLKLLEEMCMTERRKSFAKDIQSLDKSEQAVLKSMLPCLEKGMKRECKKESKRKLRHEKRLEEKCSLIAKKDKIRKLLKYCEKEKIQKQKNNKTGNGDQTAKKKSETSASKANSENKFEKIDPIANICLYLKLCKNTPECSGKADSPKDQYLLKLKKAIRQEWTDICQIRQKLTKVEQQNLSISHKCVASQIKQICKLKVLKEMCKESKKSENSAESKSLKCPHKEAAKETKMQQNGKKASEKQNKGGSQSQNKQQTSMNNGIFKDQKQNIEGIKKLSIGQNEKPQKLESGASKKESDRIPQKNKKEEKLTNKKDMISSKTDDKSRESENKGNENEEEALRKQCKEAAKRKCEYNKALVQMKKDAECKKRQEQEILKQQEKNQSLQQKIELEAELEKKELEYQKRKKDEEILQKNCDEAALRIRLRALKKICEEKILKKKREAEVLRAMCREDARKKENENAQNKDNEYKKCAEKYSENGADKNKTEVEKNKAASNENIEADTLDMKFKELALKCAEEMRKKKEEEQALKKKQTDCIDD